MENEEEIRKLKKKLEARKGQTGMETNCKAIEARIAELEAEQ